MSDSFGARQPGDRLLALFNVGGGPDRVERLVEAESRIDIAREFVGLCDNRLECRTDECCAVSLTAGQGAGVGAKIWQLRGKFLAKGHSWLFSLEIVICAVFDDGSTLLQPWKNRGRPGIRPPPEISFSSGTKHRRFGF